MNQSQFNKAMDYLTDRYSRTDTKELTKEPASEKTVSYKNLMMFLDVGIQTAEAREHHPEDFIGYTHKKTTLSTLEFIKEMLELGVVA